MKTMFTYTQLSEVGQVMKTLLTALIESPRPVGFI